MADPEWIDKRAERLSNSESYPPINSMMAMFMPKFGEGVKEVKPAK